MIGPLLAMALGKFLGADIAPPGGGRAAGQLIIACALDLYFTPTVAAEVAAHWYLLVAAAVLAAWVPGPLAVSAAFTLGEASLSATAPWLSNAAQLLLGCSLGSGFERHS